MMKTTYKIPTCEGYYFSESTGSIIIFHDTDDEPEVHSLYNDINSTAAPVKINNIIDDNVEEPQKPLDSFGDEYPTEKTDEIHPSLNNTPPHSLGNVNDFELDTPKFQDFTSKDEVSNSDPGVQDQQNDNLSTGPPDGGCRAWLVCLACWYCYGCFGAVSNTFGIIYVPLLEEFKDEGGDIAFKTAWIGSVNISAGLFFCVISSILIDLFGVQIVSGVGIALSAIGMLASSFVYSLGVMYFTYGFVVGLGVSFTFTSANVILPQYFDKHLGKVSGVMMFGGAFFTVATSLGMPPIINKLGLRSVMRMQTGLIALMAFAPIVWKPRSMKSTDKEDPDNIRKGILKNYQGLQLSIWKNKSFVIYSLSVALIMFGYFVPITHLVNYSQKIFPDTPGYILIVCLGGVGGISRLVLGNLSDHPSIKRIWILQASTVLLGLSTCFITFTSKFGVLVFITVLMGICDGGLLSMITPTVSDLLGPDQLGRGIGTAWSLIGAATLLGPPLAGLIYDKLGTYDLVFLIGATPLILGPILMFLMPYTNYKDSINKI